MISTCLPAIRVAFLLHQIYFHIVFFHAADICQIINIFIAFKCLSKQLRDIVVMVGQSPDAADHGKGKYTLVRDPEDFQLGIYDKPLPCFGCGIGWFS